MPIPLFQIDAFTDSLYKGNPAAVCLLQKPKSNAWMQKVAQEMNLSETAFIWPASGHDYHLKWFTPITEVDLCGHATLATAHVLWDNGICAQDKVIQFDTLSGTLTARSHAGLIELCFPLNAPTPSDHQQDLEASLLSALGLNKTQLTDSLIQGKKDYLVVVKNEQQVLDVKPDFARLAKIKSRATIVTSIADKNKPYDFVSRVFVPSCGIDEDPVTGSAHCLMGPYWANKLNKQNLKAVQLSPRRGEIELDITENVLLRGQARSVFKGELLDHE